MQSSVTIVHGAFNMSQDTETGAPHTMGAPV